MGFKLPLRKIFHKHVPGVSRFSFPLSWAMVGALSLVLVACVGWAFFMGYMVGKGQNPETQLEAMTGIKISADSDAPETGEIDVLQEPVSKTGETATQTEVYPFNRPEGAETEAWESPDKVVPAKAAKPPAKREPTRQKRENPENARSKGTNAQRYDFLFQIAAYKNVADANRLRASLEKGGIKAVVQKSGKVHLVTMRMRGTELDAKRLPDRLASFKLGKPMQLSKKPVEVKKGQRGAK